MLIFLVFVVQVASVSVQAPVAANRPIFSLLVLRLRPAFSLPDVQIGRVFSLEVLRLLSLVAHIVLHVWIALRPVDVLELLSGEHGVHLPIMFGRVILVLVLLFASECLVLEPVDRLLPLVDVLDVPDALRVLRADLLAVIELLEEE